MEVNSLTVLSWNVRSLTSSRIADVHCYGTQHNTDIILLQETGDKCGTALKLNGYVGHHLQVSVGVRGVSTYVKSTIPSVLLVAPDIKDGIESVCVEVHFQDCVMNVINLYVSSNSFGVTALPDPIFQGVMTLVAGDLNARHRSLESGGKTNVNDTRLVQFLSDFPQARLLGSQEATHIQGGRLDYACLVNYQGVTGISIVISDLLSDHFAIGIRLPLTKRKVQCDRKRLSLPKDKVDHFI
ncbi:hypothetical protein GWK47_018397 [Chionoecetes opilio]|uniref:Endonuclease/exonuclease/phosphatase domain-containing protein n=1 Tax=Chionoecetes opilio TaxID=41210 RepID=A0A8J5CIN3_CHIOP|nr:hypothetical protein GWK47_018397 [Chionoecetes opilio]